MRYFLGALSEVVAALRERPTVPVRSLRIETIPEEVKSPPESGPTPFRLYQDIASLVLLRRYAPTRAEILDLGCGPGPGEHHFRALGVRGHYLGVDVIPDPGWRELERKTAESTLPCRFLAMDARAIRGLGPFDVVYSSSSLEHMPELPRVAANIAEVTAEGGLSFHLVPAPFSIFVYGAHGFRRFSAGRIEALFREAGFRVEALFALGGLASYVVHGIFATLPSVMLRRDLRARLPRAYARALRAAVSIDARVPVPHLGFVLVARRSWS